MTWSPDRRWAFSLPGLLLVTVGVLASAQPDFALNSLTVPAVRLPEGCGLTSSEPLEPPPAPIVGMGTVYDSKRLTSSPANPWLGSEPEMVNLIRYRVEPEPKRRLLPDGGPIDRRQAIAWQKASDPRWNLSDGITEAYRATYVTPYGGQVEVSAVRYRDANRASQSAPVPFIEPRVPTRFVRGSTVVVVSGTSGSPCFEAVRSYLQRALR